MGFVQIVIFSILVAVNCSYAKTEPTVDLLLRLKEKDQIFMGSQNKIEKLPKDSLISVTVPRSILAERIEETSLAKLSVSGILSYTEVTVLESKRKKKLIGVTGFMGIARAAQENKLTVVGFEENSESILDEVLSEEELAASSQINNQACVMCAETPEEDYFTYMTQSPLDQYLPTYEELILASQNSEIIKNLIQSAKKFISYKDKKQRWFLRTWSTGKCLRFVKLALQKAGLTRRADGSPAYLGMARAKQIGPELTKHGFKNLLEIPFKFNIESPYDAPIGSILVYDGGKSGHVEIKIPDGFISDYFSDEARTGRPENGLQGRDRRLIGVYVRAS